MLKKIILATIVLFLCPSAANAEGACRACSLWSTWGEREQICAAPSEGLWDDLLACLQRPDGDPAGGCATSCSSYLTSYDACAASGDPACIPGGAPVCGGPYTDCDLCLEYSCRAYATPCSDDTTECTHCSTWLDGTFDGSMTCPNSIQEVLDLSACACSGPCATKCGAACSHPCAWVLDPNSASFACGICLGSKCSTTYGACAAD